MEEKEKDTVWQIRLNSNEKNEFMTYCKSKAINASELVRQLINQCLNEQKTKTHHK